MNLLGVSLDVNLLGVSLDVNLLGVSLDVNLLGVSPVFEAVNTPTFCRPETVSGKKSFIVLSLKCKKIHLRKKNITSVED